MNVFGELCAYLGVCVCMCICVGYYEEDLRAAYYFQLTMYDSASPRCLHFDSWKICRPMRSWLRASLR